MFRKMKCKNHGFNGSTLNVWKATVGQSVRHGLLHLCFFVIMYEATWQELMGFTQLQSISTDARLQQNVSRFFLLS